MSGGHFIEHGRVVYDLPSGPITANGNSADFDVSDLHELAVVVDVTAATGTTPTLDIYVESKDANGVYYTLWHPAQIVAAGLVSTSIGDGLATNQAIGDTVRVRWAVTGTTPSFTTSISVEGK